MDKSIVKQLIRETLEPVFDELVDTSFRIFSSLVDNLPDNMSDDEKRVIVENIIKQQNQAIIAGIKSSIPEDYEKQMKEAFNGRKQ